MKTHFHQEKFGRSSSTAGFSRQVASALALLGACYVFTPICLGAGSNMLVHTCAMEQGESDLHGASSAADIGDASVRRACQQNSYGTVHSDAKFDSVPNVQTQANATHGSADPSNSAHIPMMVSMSTADRHWCVAEAFNAALDHQKLVLAIQKTPAVVVR